MISQYTTQEIRRITHDLSENTAPSLHLRNMLNLMWLLQIQTMETRVRLAEGKPAQLDGTEEANADIDREWRLYSLTPPLPGELELRRESCRIWRWRWGTSRTSAKRLAAGHRALAISLLDRELPRPS